MVWPIIAGTIIERRDHVLMTVLVPLSFCTSTFFIRWSSTNGPFLRLRGMWCPILWSALAGLATADDQLVTGLALARTAFRLDPWRDRAPATGRLGATTP